ncbi:hypothetical protein M5K25_000253 [Dendrobium thyrsiflorum]|uniref:Uncharacterized protein n=1 Tax=Dendrobium thyrsiflorum TaxID=117978 RepID=A0ABD0W3Y9_DENTH
MEDMFLDPIIEKIISAGFRYLKDQVRWQTGMKEELVKLQKNLPQIQAVVHFASSQEQITDQNPSLNKWLWQLRDAIDDADDVLDDLEYMELEKQVTKNKKLRRVRSIMKSMKKRLVKIVKRALKIDPTLKRLEEAVQELYRVSTTGVETFLRLAEQAKQEHQKQQHELHGAREEGYLPKNDLIGRGKDKESVVQWLRNPSNEHRGTELYRNISLLSIVGHGGMGKTALLQHVYKDEITKEFDRQMWVCVSNNFDKKKVIADMLESLKKERTRLETLGELQGALEKEVMSKKFLLVLDDIWEEDEDKDKSKWEDVLAPLASGGFGSKILVTTRTDSIALMFAKLIKKKKEIVKLEGLEEDECLRLLNSHAFAGVENPSDDHENLRVIAAEIVKKLLGSPLAAKVVGGVLNDNLDEMYWSTVLESNLLGQSSIHSILRLSYIVLPKLLQNCLAFCCTFPQDHEFDKDDLVRMWIALGFIQPSQEMTMEDIGRRYFDVLIKKALFDKVDDDYKMHDLIHESASKFFAHECGKLVDDEESSLKNFETIRHLSVRTTNPVILRKIEKFKHLHSLFLFYEGSNQDHCSALIKIFEASRCLRLLYMHIDELKMIPEEIRYLKHLRYLMIEGDDVTRLPRSLSNLYHLQYLVYDRWKSGQPEFLPSDINNLSNLRHVKLNNEYISSICGIGKLKSLQELHIFDLRDEMGYRIDEFKYLNDLCILGINCLENVKDAEEARDAQLCEKKRLTDLTLSWGSTDSRNIDLDENVFDNLQPPKCLRNLCIEGYTGARSAIWMNNVNLLSNIKKIELSCCWEWETLPPFGQLPFLKSLSLRRMPKVKWLESKFNENDKYRAFPLLEELYIYQLEALEDWFEAGVAAEDGCLFPCLIRLELLNCPKLKVLPSLPPKLKTLMITETEWTTLNFCSNSNPIPLESLEVRNCQKISRLSSDPSVLLMENVLQNLQPQDCPRNLSIQSYMVARSAIWKNNVNPIFNLERIELSDCLEWEILPPFGQLPFLKSLSLHGMPKVKWLESKFNGNDKNRAFPLLEKLLIRELEALEDWFEAGVAAEDGCLFPCLIELKVRNCPKLKDLPSLPPKLKSLEIFNNGWTTLNFCSNSNPIPLERLWVLDCPNVTSLPLADEIARLAALRYLTIINCPNLISLGEMQTTNNCHLILSDLSISDPSVLLMEPLRSIASLKRLTIMHNDELVSFPNEAEQWFLNVRSSLSELQFCSLRSLESLPSSLESISSLQKLSIEYGVPMLRELPNLPPSVKTLIIWGRCHPELYERYRGDGGSDRHKIAHIPHIDIRH